MTTEPVAATLTELNILYLYIGFWNRHSVKVWLVVYTYLYFYEYIQINTQANKMKIFEFTHSTRYCTEGAHVLDCP